AIEGVDRLIGEIRQAGHAPIEGDPVEEDSDLLSAAATQGEGRELAQAPDRAQAGARDVGRDLAPIIDRAPPRQRIELQCCRKSWAAAIEVALRGQGIALIASVFYDGDV